MKDFEAYFTHLEHDTGDPNPWQALFYDKSIPFNRQAKAAFLYDSQTRSRQYLLPVIRVFARLSIMLIQLIKIVTPKRWSSPKLLHRFLYWGMKYFITPQANYLILRHFNLGSEVLQFIADNSGVQISMNPLKPLKLEAVKDNLFLDHDLNLYNFIIRLNKALEQEGKTIHVVADANYRTISASDFAFEEFRNGWTNCLDLMSAIEIFTPVYQLFLTDSDFWRATNSLQLDEIIGVYAATIINAPEKLIGLNNKHPMVPLSTLRAGFRLTLHGLSTEILHALLVENKLAQMVETEQVG